jgi:two-component system, chemotaxis family, CheB/CheR fusion protein
MESARGQAQAKRLELESEFPKAPIVVRGDPERVGQILDNLLRNALNFTDRGSIRVTVQRSGKEAVVTVRDTGVGVEQDRIASVFSASGRSEHSTGSGLGVGLSLLKQLVELHDGRVIFRSEGPGLGSEVTFKIPLLSPGAAATESAGNGNLASRRIW